MIMRVLLFLSVFLLGIGGLTAQEIRTNDRGEKIIVYPDGSWKYFDGSAPDPAADPTAGMSDEEAADYLDQKARKTAIQRAERARAEANRLERAFREARIARLLAERELENLDGSSPSAVEEAEAEVELKKDAQQLAEARWENATDYADALSDLIYVSRKKRSKKMTKLDAKRTAWLQKNDPSYRPKIEEIAAPQFDPVPASANGIEPPKEPAAPAITPPRPRPVNREYATYRPENDVITNPPAPDCTLAFDGVDEFTKVKRKQTQSTLFFSHTNKELRDIFTGEDDYITAYGHLVQVDGGTRILVIDYYIASQTADRAFGALRPNAAVTLRFLDGETFKLFNGKYDAGKYDPVTGKYHFQGQYSVSGKVQKMVTKSELDQVRVVWETGYEDYPVYQLDFLRDQFECLEQ